MIDEDRHYYCHLLLPISNRENHGLCSRSCPIRFVDNIRSLHKFWPWSSRRTRSKENSRRNVYHEAWNVLDVVYSAVKFNCSLEVIDSLTPPNRAASPHHSAYVYLLRLRTNLRTNLRAHVLRISNIRVTQRYGKRRGGFRPCPQSGVYLWTINWICVDNSWNVELNLRCMHTTCLVRNHLPNILWFLPVCSWNTSHRLVPGSGCF